MVAIGRLPPSLRALAERVDREMGCADGDVDIGTVERFARAHPTDANALSALRDALERTPPADHARVLGGETSRSEISPAAASAPTFSPLEARLHNAKPSVVADSSFFAENLARGSGQLEVGPTSVRYGADGVARADVDELVKRSPVAAMVLELANQHGVEVGFYGGTARDLLFQHPIRDTSDVDLVYDSAAPGFDEFRRAVLDENVNRFGDRAWQIDFSVDMSGDRKVRGTNRGVTAEKVGLMNDGTMVDFSGQGLADLATGTLRYYSRPDHRAPGISSIFRMVGAAIQNENMRFAPETDTEIRQVLRDFYGPGSPNVENLRSFRSKSWLVKPALSIAHWLKRTVLEGRFASSPLSGLIERGRDKKWDGRKKSGVNYLDFSSTVEKIVEGGVAKNPKRALAMLDDFGLTSFLDNIGAGDDIAALRAAAAQS